MSLVKIRWEVEGQTHTSTLHAEGGLTIGRATTCDVVIPHQTVSREHARILVRGDELEIKNLSGTNAIRINSQHSLEAGEETTAPGGSTLQIGLVNIQITISDLGERIKFKVRCTNCGKVSDNTLTDCPWCGTSLAFGETYVPLSGEE